MGWWLDLMILEVFSNLNGSMILWASFFLFTDFLIASILSATSHEGYRGKKIKLLLFKEKANLHFQNLHHIKWDTSQTVHIFSYHKKKILKITTTFEQEY